MVGNVGQLEAALCLSPVVLMASAGVRAKVVAKNGVRHTCESVRLVVQAVRAVRRLRPQAVVARVILQAAIERPRAPVALWDHTPARMRAMTPFPSAFSVGPSCTWVTTGKGDMTRG
jgi:hypothetical protein